MALKMIITGWLKLAIVAYYGNFPSLVLDKYMCFLYLGVLFGRVCYYCFSFYSVCLVKSLSLLLLFFKKSYFNFTNILSFLKFNHRVTCYYAQFRGNKVNFTLATFLNYLDMFWVICQESHADLLSKIIFEWFVDWQFS